MDFTVNVIADIHIHTPPGAFAPSAQDLKALNNKRGLTSNFTTSYVSSADGNIYALYINDAAKLNTFINNNSGFVGTDNNFAHGTNIGDLFWETNDNLQIAGYTPQEAFTRATAHVLQNAGVTLLKSNATTINFKKIDLREDAPATSPNGIPVYSIIDCN
ncbi:hypothetical protein [Flavobacterium sp. LM4]|uniref:hypothetical protein n=1 Tax=Flavobacterium sp. LM4 TaxID=1938609 RepID=UPI0009938556|nr:hypothetical protein [Flavobacterium sp. LM4]OOV19566.1 hypothetical protein BXU10_07925 [Flavobacterium sp. LM4]